MAIGLSVPLVASRGRLVLESGESQMAKLIRMSCFDNASSNPWNGDAGSPSSIFKLDTPEVRGRIRSAVKTHFERWRQADRAELVSMTFAGTEDGALSVDITYRDLETERVDTVSVQMG